MPASDRITRIDGFEIACDLPAPAGNALRTFTRRTALMIRLTTAGGISGWGETWAFAAPAAAFVRTALAPVVLGADITAPRALHADSMRRVVPDRRGLAVMAVSAIDIAAWDAFARAAGQPLGRVLGGPLRDRLPAYASGPLLVEGADRYRILASAVEGYARQGYRAVKLRVGVGPAADEAAIRKAREILGSDADLMIDFNEAYSVHDTLTLARRLDDLNLRWIEEPVRHDDLPSYRALSRALTTPLAGGESFCGLEAFRDPVAERSLSILQPDIALCGGVTEVLKIAGLAEAFGLPLIPHVWGAAVNLLVAMQIAALLPAAPGRPLPLIECDMSHNPMRDAIFAPRPASDGMLAVPDGPGLGIEIDPERLQPFVTDHWTVE